MSCWFSWYACLLIGLAPLLATSQPPGDKKDPDKKDVIKGFPPFGPGGPPGGPGGVGPGQTRKLVAQFDKDGDGRLGSEERQAARDFLKKENKGGFAFGKGPGGPGAKFGPGGFFVKPLLEALDADKDGALTKKEIAAGLEKFMAEHDKDQKGSFDEKSFAAAMNRVMPRPVFFPGPGLPGFPGGKGEGKGPDGKGGPGGAGGKADGKGPGGGPGFANPFASGVFQQADKDKDGKVTLDELTKAAERLFHEADQNKDAKLDEAEVGSAIAPLFPAIPFGPGGFGKSLPPAKPGPRVTPADVKSYPNASLYEPEVLRTLFLEFENKDWEAELADFYKTDVEVPATLIVDGKTYPNVGIHFRGMSSYGMTPAGYKKSLNLSLDFADTKQRLYGAKTLNLLNSAGDPSLMSAVLYSHVARQYIPAPKANFVKLVVNGESWGVYVNLQQFNKDFVAENFKSTKGARWKVPGMPGGSGGLEYLGESIEDYRRRYQIKSPDDEKSWKALIKLCRTLNKTPPEQFEASLQKVLDIDGALKFLALDVVLSNSDGYWTRASDYSLVLDGKGKFHIVPHDMNEAFQPAMPFPGGGFFEKKGPTKGGEGGKGDGGKGEERKGDGGKGGFGGFPGGAGFGGAAGGFGPDPLVALDDARKPLRSKLLAVPAWKARYLEYVRDIAAKQLDWKNLGPVIARHRALIEKEVAIETRKTISLEAFLQTTADAPDPGAKGRPSLRAFADGRRHYLLTHSAVKQAVKEGQP